MNELLGKPKESKIKLNDPLKPDLIKNKDINSLLSIFKKGV